ncbi:MAG: tetratricopeptide repeat protein, partial [bacterium]
YFTQLMGRDAKLLFSKINGSTEFILKDLINCNWGKRELEWDLSSLPTGWNGPPAVPTLLTQRFSQVPLSPEAAEDIQSRYDLTDLVGSIGDPNPLTKRYCQRYLEGFDSLGDWLVAQKKYSGAIRTYERVLELNPDDSTAKTALAQIYTQHNLLEAARLDFTRIDKTYPTRIRKIMAQMDRMKVKNGANDAEVLNLLNETVRLSTVLADAKYHLGQLYEKDGNMTEAKKMLQSAVRMNPQRLEAQVALGLLMEKTGDRQDAEAALREALQINPVDKTVQAELWKLLNKR